MSHDAGVWIDHKKAVIVSIAAGEVTTRTLTSDIGARPHYSGSREGGGEKKYEERHNQDLDRLLRRCHQSAWRAGRAPAFRAG